MIRTSETVLVDSGYWIALFDSRDQHHTEAKQLSDWLEVATLLVPWPVMYETLRTRFVKDKLAVNRFEAILKMQNVHFVEDTEYREDAFTVVSSMARNHGRAISMIDALLRLLIEDPNLPTKYLLTFNDKDFQDICLSTSTEILRE